jgi:hypothetical protein
LLVGSFRLVYKVAPKRTLILAFIHAARDLNALWAREGESRIRDFGETPKNE